MNKYYICTIQHGDKYHAWDIATDKTGITWVKPTYLKYYSMSFDDSPVDELIYCIRKEHQKIVRWGNGSKAEKVCQELKNKGVKV